MPESSPTQPPCEPGEFGTGTTPSSTGTPPGEPDAGHDGKARKRKARVLLASAVAAGVALVAVGFLVLRGGEEPDSPGVDAGAEGRELFKIKAPELPEGESGLWLRGAWVTDAVYARTTTFGVMGVDPANGKRKWRLRLDGLVCNVSERISSSGKTALLMTANESAQATCNKLVVFDLESGKKEWQTTLRAEDVAVDSKAVVTISRDIVATRWGRGGAAAHRISDGSQLWKTGRDRECVPEAFTGGEELMAVVTCDDARASVESRVQRLDPETGRPTWEFKVPGVWTPTKLVSADPVIIQRPRELTVVGEDRKTKSTIPLKKHNPGCRADSETCLKAVADGNDLFLPSVGRRSDDGSSTNSVTAFDLDTGEPRWSSGAGKGRHIEPLRMEGEKLIAYKGPTRDAGGEIVAIDPADNGKHQELRLRNPDGEEAVELGFTRTTHEERPLYANGRLYLQWSTLSDNYTDGLGKYVSAAFGPGRKPGEPR